LSTIFVRKMFENIRPTSIGWWDMPIARASKMRARDFLGGSGANANRFVELIEAGKTPADTPG
jgi:hypothetical protein